jgi:hypothetical protein
VRLCSRPFRVGFTLGQEITIDGKHNGVDPSGACDGPASNGVQSVDWKLVARDAERPDPVRGGTFASPVTDVFRIVISYDRYMLERLTPKI